MMITLKVLPYEHNKKALGGGRQDRRTVSHFTEHQGQTDFGRHAHNMNRLVLMRPVFTCQHHGV